MGQYFLGPRWQTASLQTSVSHIIMMPQELQTHMELLKQVKLYRLVLITLTIEIIAKYPKEQVVKTHPLFSFQSLQLCCIKKR